jgi:hypothetical protein
MISGSCGHGESGESGFLTPGFEDRDVRSGVAGDARFEGFHFARHSSHVAVPATFDVRCSSPHADETSMIDPWMVDRGSGMSGSSTLPFPVQNVNPRGLPPYPSPSSRRLIRSAKRNRELRRKHSSSNLTGYGSGNH